MYIELVVIINFTFFTDKKKKKWNLNEKFSVNITFK